jgi:hypothetical protein
MGQEYMFLKGVSPVVLVVESDTVLSRWWNRRAPRRSWLGYASFGGAVCAGYDSRICDPRRAKTTGSATFAERGIPVDNPDTG